MKRVRWFQTARIGGVVWCLLAMILYFSFKSEIEEIDILLEDLPLSQQQQYGSTSPEYPTGEEKNERLRQREVQLRMEREAVKLKWLKMALIIFVLLVLLPLALCLVEKDEKQHKSTHTMQQLWKWVRNSFVAVTILYCCVFVFAFTFDGFLEDEEEGRGILIQDQDAATRSAGVQLPSKELTRTRGGPEMSMMERDEESGIGGSSVFFAVLRWGIGLALVAPFLALTGVVSYLGYLRCTERVLLTGRGKDIVTRTWGALMCPEELGKDLAMMGLPLLAVCAEVSLYGSRDLHPGQQLVILSSILSLYISGFLVPVIVGLIAKGAVCYTLQHKDKDNETGDSDGTGGIISMISASSVGKACAAGIVMCWPLILLSAMLSTPILRFQRAIIILLSTLKGWIISIAGGFLGVLQFNLRRSLVMGDRVAELLMLISSVSLLAIVALSLFFTDIGGSFDFINLNYHSTPSSLGSSWMVGESLASHADLVAFVDVVYIFGFSLSALVAYNRLKYL